MLGNNSSAFNSARTFHLYVFPEFHALPFVGTSKRSSTSVEPGRFCLRAASNDEMSRCTTRMFVSRFQHTLPLMAEAGGGAVSYLDRRFSRLMTSTLLLASRLSLRGRTRPTGQGMSSSVLDSFHKQSSKPPTRNELCDPDIIGGQPCRTANQQLASLVRARPLPEGFCITHSVGEKRER